MNPRNLFSIFIERNATQVGFGVICTTLTFSALQRLKTYLRSTMAQDRLNHLLLLYCHKARTDAIDLSKIASAHVSIN